MEDKIIGFQEKLVDYRKRRRRNLAIKISVVGVLLLLVILYVLTPLSRVSSYSLTGNKNITSSQVLEIAGINRSTSLLTLNASEVEKKLNDNPLISNAKVSVDFCGLKVSFDENAPTLKKSDGTIFMTNESYSPEWLNDEVLGETLQESINTVPLLLPTGIETSANIGYFGQIYYNISSEYRKNIKFIEFKQDEDKTNYVNYYLSIPRLEDNYLKVRINVYSISQQDWREAIAYALDSSSYSRWEKYIFDIEDQMATLESTKQTYTENDQNFNYYSIKVIIIKNNGEFKYGIYTESGTPFGSNTNNA